MRGAQQIKGYTAEEIVGKHFSIFYPPELRGTSPTQALALVRKAGKFEEEGWRFRKRREPVLGGCRHHRSP